MKTRMQQSPSRYRVDAEDRVRLVNTEWLSFARENDAKELDRDATIGRSLWEFVAGKETRHLYQVLFDTACSQQSEIEVPFRCDSPTCRRFMELSIVSSPDGSLDFTAWLIRKEARKSVALLNPSTPRSDDFLTICSWCKRVLIASKEWLEAETAIRRLRLFSSERLPQLTHGACGECSEVLLRQTGG